MPADFKTRPEPDHTNSHISHLYVFGPRQRAKRAEIAAHTPECGPDTALIRRLVVTDVTSALTNCFCSSGSCPALARCHVKGGQHRSHTCQVAAGASAKGIPAAAEAISQRRVCAWKKRPLPLHSDVQHSTARCLFVFHCGREHRQTTSS